MFMTLIILILRERKMKKIHKFMKQNRIQNIWDYILTDNPTPQQRMNRLKWKRFWRNFWREGELMLPFFFGIMLLGLIAYITITNPNL